MTIENCQSKKAEDFENNQPKMTLDEVIKAWSICFSDNSRSDCTGCPYADEDGDAACFNHDREDALHYLKEYQSEKKLWEADRKMWAEKGPEIENKQDKLIKAAKDFQKTKAEMEEISEDYVALKQWWTEQQVNPPLSWDELKTMVGKPVWVEDNLETPEDITKYWAIMWRVEKAEDDEYALLSDFYFQKSQYGKDWQTYRKERE